MGWRAADAQRAPPPPIRSLPCCCSRVVLLILLISHRIEVVGHPVAFLQVRSDVRQAVAVAVAGLELGGVAEVRVRHGTMGGCSQVGWVAGHNSEQHAL